MTNIRVGCPQCGDMCPMGEGRREVAPDGSVRYYFARDPAGDVHDRAFADLLIADIRAAQSAEDAAQILEQHAPWLAPLSAWLRENNAYAGWLGLVVTIILHFVPSPTDEAPPAPPSPTQVEETLQEILKELQEQTTREQPGTSLPAAPPAGELTSPPTSTDRGSPSPPERQP